ncbi:putative riboflavin biosynthesis protein RibBA [Nocardia nova SH22a]|uniref:3,4-dihydroxy-2-butanone-4-phosphate synthase n=2 Tax=Nocardia nova TaxID=37330 RepID=W5TLA5_9NOCA|nr:putative riboflavin biosynthesis protein RibBA [Nocardia nova SH22a]
MECISDDRLAVDRVARELRSSRPVLVIDDVGAVRQPAAVIVCAAASATTTTVAFMVRHTSGYLEVALPSSDCARLGLPLMSGVDPVGNDATRYTVTVDAAAGTGTGISAADRATTMRQLADGRSAAASFTRPGHVQPVGTGSADVRTHRDFAHAAVDLARIAEISPACGIGHLVSETRPVELADTIEARDFADRHRLAVVHIGDIVRWHSDRATFVAVGPPFETRTRHGAFIGTTYRLSGQSTEYVVLTLGAPRSAASTPVYVHDECLGQALSADACNCQENLTRAMIAIARVGHGVVVYTRQPTAGSPCAVHDFAPGTGPMQLEPIHRRLLCQLAINRIHAVQPVLRTCVACKDAHLDAANTTDRSWSTK